MDHAEAIKMIEHNEEVFEVRKEVELNGWKLMRVFYPNCPNGDKIMLFELAKAPIAPYTRIMPHFNLPTSPAIRFEPTEWGWNLAMRFMEQCPNR